VEVPPFARALPRGTRHLRVQGLVPVCRQLGVDFAPALAGFDPQGGRMVPRLEGIVVCEVRGGVRVKLPASQAPDTRPEAGTETCHNHPPPPPLLFPPQNDQPGASPISP